MTDGVENGGHPGSVTLSVNSRVGAGRSPAARGKGVEASRENQYSPEVQAVQARRTSPRSTVKEGLLQVRETWECLQESRISGDTRGRGRATEDKSRAEEIKSPGRGLGRRWRSTERPQEEEEGGLVARSPRPLGTKGKVVDDSKRVKGGIANLKRMKKWLPWPQGRTTQEPEGVTDRLLSRTGAQVKQGNSFHVSH